MELVKNNLLAIGIDERVFTDPSLKKKVLEYGNAFDTAHIVCRSSDPDRRKEIEGSVIFYPAYSRFPFMFPFKVWLLGKKLVRNDPGKWLVVADSPFEVGFISWFISQSVQGKLFVQIHTDFMSSYFRRGSIKDRIRYHLAKFVAARADCIRVVSERVRNSLARLNLPREVQPQSISVLPIFTDVAKFLDAQRDSATDQRFKNYEFKIIAVGRFVDKEKNFSMLIDVMRDFAKICPKALLVLVGDGPDRKNYEARIKSQGLEKYVILEKYRNDLPSFLKSFDLFLMPSNYEGWGRVAIEAMAAGLPVVMTDVGLAGEVVNPVRKKHEMPLLQKELGDNKWRIPRKYQPSFLSNGVKNGENGLVVPVGDKEAILAAVTALYRNKEKRAQFSRNNVELVRKLEPKTESEYFRRYKNLLCDCLQKF